MHDQGSGLKPVPVRRRSAARLAAIQIVYQSLITSRSSFDFAPEFLAHYAPDILASFKVKTLDEAHLSALYSAVESGAVALDEVIGAALVDGWSLDRLSRIELAILRCGAVELREMPHIPARAVVSEYAALTDSCGGEVGFVNAVLDRLARQARTVEMR